MYWTIPGSDPPPALIVDPDNDITVSPATCWEIAIKISLRKYQLREPHEAFMQRQFSNNRFRLLPIELRHTAALTTLPFHHRDPFDRLLVAQALVEEIPLLSADATLDAYGVTRLW
ncbi:MAG: type II toxin-antitoxin system VapC family toxin [Gammaproteobacteria bacterium]